MPGTTKATLECVPPLDHQVELRNILNNAMLQRICEGVDGLPPAPRIYTELIQAASEPRTAARDLGRIVETDPAISAAVLQLANSAFFGRMRRMVAISDAVGYLGIELLKAVVLSAHLARVTLVDLPRGMSVDSFQARSLRLARIAHRFTSDRMISNLVFTASLILDIGQLVLAIQRPRVYEAVLEQSRLLQRPLHEVEVDHLGASHAEAGAFLLAAWGLPEPIIECVAFHHRPSVRDGSVGARAVLHAADAMLAVQSGEQAEEHLDLALIEKAEFLESIPQWRRIVTAEIEGAS
ncbi:MAG: HDOD domain-containing protein [Kofleriaceae bacterium]|nr:HDOD domain-containing protein [Kofleriaceae bacterium]